jgi:hypothetical protein
MRAEEVWLMGAGAKAAAEAARVAAMMSFMLFVGLLIIDY